MQENKYFYNGIPLTKYCKDNDINVSTIRSRIWKKKNSKKYENYTEQEIVDMVVEAYGCAVKYMYKGISLRQYCLKNGIIVGTINSRIASLREENKDLSNDELVILAMEEYENKNYRFFYDGMPLIEYCELHPDINYNTIRTYINREKENNPEKSDEEIIDQYINKEHKGIYKYYYLGIPLKKYCEENDLNYKNIILYISRHKNDSEYENLSDDEFVEAIMDKYQPFEAKYVYKGMTLREYCIKNNLSYFSVISFVKRKLLKGVSKSIDELIDEGINTINRYGIIYYYKGIPLKDYCEENGLNAHSIRCAILKMKLKSGEPLQDIVDKCVESYQKFSVKYFYDGIPLYKFCNSVGINYNTVIYKYLNEYEDRDDINIDEAIKQIVDYYIENPPVRTKYYFDNQSLSRFCDKNGYPYLSIYRRIKTLESKDNSLDGEQVIASAIKKYEDRLQINKINDIFDKLKNMEVYDVEEIKNICNFLKIDFLNVCDLVNMDFSYNQAINMIWYFSDKKTNNDFKMITDNKIKDIFSLIDKIKSSRDIEQFEFYDLVGIYKSELYDSRNEILLRQRKFIYKTIYSLCGSYGITVNKSNFEDFVSDIKYYLLTVINRSNLNVYGQMVKYMDLTVKGYFRTSLKKYIKHNNGLSLDDSRFISDKGTRREKSNVEYVADNRCLDIISEDNSFCSNMMKVLSSLSREDLLFVMLKYQENYSDEELAYKFNLTMDEIKEKEFRILSLLRDNDDMKVLKRTRNDS